MTIHRERKSYLLMRFDIKQFNMGNLMLSLVTKNDIVAIATK